MPRFGLKKGVGMNKFRLYASLATFSLIAASMSAVAVAYAAYLNANQYELPIDANTVTLSSKFTNGGSGTLASPYLISSATDLRTLQKLNILGVFSASTYFQMDGDIVYSGDALMPIGNEDYPFYSQFDGNGYKISNLVVNGANTNDIGMFGYTAIGSMIKNLVLITPTINVTQNTIGSSLHAPTTNPMEPILSSAGINIGTLGYTNSRPAVFTVPRTSVTGTDNATYTIIYQSTNTSLLYQSSPGVWTCGIPNVAKPTSIYPVSLVARVFALYNNQVISYTLERWQINVLGDGSVYAGTSTTNPGYFKCVHNTTYPHETYVGLFVGHLDGGADFLGMYGGNLSGAENGIITVNGRNARSYSCLVGYSRLDNPQDDAAANMDQKYLDFNTIIPERNLMGTSYSILEGTNPITDFTTQYNRAVSASLAYGLTTDDVKITRFYPGLENTSIQYTNPDSSVSTFYVNRTSAPLGAGVRQDYMMYGKTGGPYFYDWFLRDATVRNGIWVWVNAANNSFTRRIINSTSYEVSIKIDYVATSDSTLNNFQILYNAYNPDLLPSSNRKPRNYLANEHWIDLGTSYDTLGNRIYNPDDFPVVTTQGGGTTSGVLTTRTLSFIVDRSAEFWSNLSKGTYYPVFAIGVGKGNAVATNNNAGSTYHYFYDDFVANPFQLNTLRTYIRLT